MKILILDDSPERHAIFLARYVKHDLVQVYSVDAAIKAVEAESPFDAMFLDHDLTTLQSIGLNDGEPSGTVFARYLAELPDEKRPAQIIIHSWNDAGRTRMAGILKDAGYKNVVIQPFSS